MKASTLFSRTALLGAVFVLAGCANSPAGKASAPVASAAGKPGAPSRTIQVQTWFIEMKTATPTARAFVAKLEEQTGMKKIGGNTGILSATQAKAVWAELKALGQFDILSAPTVSVASGNQARITVGEEMRYPASWETDATKTRWTPMDHASRLVGVESEVSPTLRDNGSISLDLRATATEFDGFERIDKPGAPAGKVPADAITLGGKPMKIEGPVMPMFSVRSVKTQISLRPGETLVLQGTPPRKFGPTDDVKTPSEIDPAESGTALASFIFVTATLETPAGQRPAP